MSLTINVDVFSPKSVQMAVDALESYKKDLTRKAKLIVEKLASKGAVKASLDFSRAIYNGKNDIAVKTQWVNGSTIAIIASGHAVLFVEFGAGITYGNGHPEPKNFGAGTYPSEKGHWNDPKGWWYTDENDTSQHTYGNPPHAVMYSTRKELCEMVEQVAREVFATND